MKTSIKKLVALMLVFALVFSCFSACGDSEKKKKDDTKNTKESAAPADSADPGTEEGGDGEAEKTEKLTFDDLGGKEILVGDWFTPEEEDLSTQYAEDTKAYREEIQSKYNFKISRKSIASWGDIQELFTTSVVNKDPIAQVVYLYQTQVARPLQAGLFYDLAKLKSFDFSEEKWNKKCTELMTVGDGIYGMQTEQEPRGGIFYNKRLFEEAGINPEEPYDLQKSGEWNWAKFEEYCSKLTVDTDKDGKTDQYAMASFSKDYYKLCAASNGALFVNKKDGKFENATGTAEFMEAIQWGTSLIEKKYIMPKPEGANWDWFIAAFRDCEVAIQAAEVYQVSTWDTMEDDFGFVLFPAGTKGTMCTVPQDNIIVIPSCYEQEEAEQIAFAYDLYTEPTPGYEDEETWKMNFYTNFRDTRAVDETLAMMRDEQYQKIDYLPLVYGMDYGDFAYPVYALAKTPAEQLEEITPTWNALIDDMNSRYN